MPWKVNSVVQLPPPHEGVAGGHTLPQPPQLRTSVRAETSQPSLASPSQSRKPALHAATRQPARPIYLEDGKWGPSYIHALWYATVEKRPRSEFVHLEPGAKPPAGKIVISSAEGCEHCETIMRADVYQVYKSL